MPRPYTIEDLESAKRLAVQPPNAYAVALEVLAAHVARLEALTDHLRRELGVPCRCETLVKAGDEYGDHEVDCRQAKALALTVWQMPLPEDPQ